MADKKKPKTRQKKIRKKNNLHRLCVEMNRLVIDANDKEYVRRFKTVIDTSAEEITKSSLDMVLSRPGETDSNAFPESLQPYIKHYIFMVKRNGR